MSKVSKDLLDGKEIENSDIQSFYWNQSNDHIKNLLGLVNDEGVQWIRQDLPETIVDQPIPMELFPISGIASQPLLAKEWRHIEVGGSTLDTHCGFVVEYGKDKDVVSAILLYLLFLFFERSSSQEELLQTIKRRRESATTSDADFVFESASPGSE
ncbi:putative PKHD-type hydroxylase [Senna tora]|uniref:Putative PKHD-type hydroxylase n=1 Tax=Senna tora TaxID=362788 RepID=A0A834SUK2_9FABA|nr:putative PKHD-type hydroxylase [Senna tora]